MKDEVVVTPLDDIKGVEEYMVAENLKDGHNKVYILCHVIADAGDRLLRFWGRHDATLQVTDESWSEGMFSHLVATKLSAKKNYDILEPEHIMAQEARYRNYRQQIEDYLRRKAYAK